MKTMFDIGAHEAMVQRIQKLKADSTAIWGRMSAGQMLSHVQIPVQLALGEATIKRNLIGFLLGGFAKKQLISDKPFKPNLPTHPDFVRKGIHDFEVERQTLLSMLERLKNGGPAIITKAPHPFFGKMHADEWALLLWKHFDHHLRQFGV